MKLPLAVSLISMLLPLVQVALAQSAAPPAPTKTTEVLVLLTVKPGITREQIMPVMPDEIRATVRVYLDGKIRQWFSRGDGKGVVFLLDAKDVAEAKSIMESLPLAKENLANFEYIPLAPLMPLRLLLGPAAAKP